MTAPIIVWLRNDLRLADHPALHQAAAEDVPVMPLYVLDEDTPGNWSLGGASRWWLHQSLTSLQTSMRHLGNDLILRRGEAAKTIAELVHQAGAAKVYCSRQFEPWAQKQEERVHTHLSSHGIELHRFAGSLLHEPDRLRTKSQQPFQVFTPFWRALSSQEIRVCRPEPLTLKPPLNWPESDPLESWELCPQEPDWAGGLRQMWQPGAGGAKQRLDAFLTGKADLYHHDRDRPDLPGTSKLSPHLHFGEISPALCWHAALAKASETPSAAEGLSVFRKELAWREFSYHLLHHWPELPSAPFRKKFANFPWQSSNEIRNTHLQAWQQGSTGYPIVDAGMRELWRTGWMHNRVRMIVASFLTKHLLIPWQSGEAWFWDCLVDADLASNAASWQWVAGCGADAAPYFRIFNPITQGQKFDPDGSYVRYWVPEIAQVPTKHIHAPWLCPQDILDRCNVSIGRTYPSPIVDHKEARTRALASYEYVKNSDL